MESLKILNSGIGLKTFTHELLIFSQFSGVISSLIWFHQMDEKAFYHMTSRLRVK